MEREKIKLSLFYLMLCLIILLCLSNKVIAKENTPNSYNIPTDCYLKVTPRKKKTVLTQSSTPQITVKKTTKVTTKKERMKNKKNWTYICPVLYNERIKFWQKIFRNCRKGKGYKYGNHS